MEGAKEMLAAEKEYQEGFEARLYKRWEEPLDLLECLIGLSLVYGQSHRDKLAKLLNETNSAKFAALVKIHQRALQVSNEILVLLKAGYADGANARWRTLCELGVISFFLRDSDNQVSQRYLDHQAIRSTKDAIAYQAYCEELGEQPFEKEEFEKIEKEKENVCSKYTDGFGDPTWIGYQPLILQNQWFKALAEHVGLGRWLPYYNLASAASHGLSRGFYRLGLPVESQDTHFVVAATLDLLTPFKIRPSFCMM